MPNWAAAGPSLAGLLAACVDLTSDAGRGLLGVVNQLIVQENIVRTTISAVVVVLVASWRFSSPRLAGFARLRSRPAGAGKQGNNWEKDGSVGVEEGVSVTWLSGRELTVLQAIGDTLLPGFEIGTEEGVDAVVEQAVDMVRNNILPAAGGAIGETGGGTRRNTATPALPPKMETYVRAIARRCLPMHGRPGSDIGVAMLYAQAFETNISAEQRSGLRLLFLVLSTRAGALILTGRAVPFQAQSLAARHALLKRWSVSRIGKFREAFQGVKRLACSLYFTAHPEEIPTQPNPVETRVSLPKEQSDAAAASAAMERKTNPNWIDIRYDPQHLRFARDGNPHVPGNSSSSSSSSSSGGQHRHHHHRHYRSASAASDSSAGAAKTGLWSGAAKVKGMISTSPARVLATNTISYSNPPSPASSVPLASAFSFSAAAQPTAAQPTAPPNFFERARSKSTSSAPPPAVATASNTSTTTRARDDIPRVLDVDVVVVGSGAGGGCAAGSLAAKGLKVAVLEKGGLYGAKDFAEFSEMEAYKNLYEGQGIVATDDGAVVILAGSCVGGGTTVNWAASFRTPRHVRLEWARKLGLKSFEPGGPYDTALDVVCERLGVNTDHSHRAPGCPTPHVSLRVNQHQSSLWNGAAASGRIPRPVPMNVEGCMDCGSCLHGCASGSKRSTHATWLQDGLASGNIILVPNAKVDRVIVDGGRATGVEATVTPPEGGKATPLTVRARAVVVSGGALHTPAILLRSGLKHPMIGRHLCLHPVLVVGGTFPEDYDGKQGGGHGLDGDDTAAASTQASVSTSAAEVGKAKAKAKAKAKTKAKTKTKSKEKAGPALEGSEAPGLCERVPGVGRGVMMGVYVQDLMRLDKGYGCVIEAPPAHPGLMGLVLPWNDALTHRLLVGMSRETSVFLCIGRDRSSNDNRVVLGPRGDPVIKYKLGKEDSQVILQGRSEMLRMMRKAGASMLLAAHEGAPWFCPGDGEGSDEQFEEYVDTIESLGTTANEAGLYSAHQMGTCRLSANPEDGPLRESGETWECNGLFVADASVFPTSLGINPMITVEAVAYMVADQVATRLGKKTEDLMPRAGSSPLRRKMKSFGKAVVAAMSREPSYTSDAGSQDMQAVDTSGGGESNHGEVSAWDVSPQSPVGVKAKAKSKAKAKAKATQKADDFGVELADISW